MHPSTSAREFLALKKQQDTIHKHYGEYLSGEIALPDVMAYITQVSPDPLSRALFRSLFNIASKDEIRVVRMIVSGIKYGKQSDDSAGSNAEEFRKFKDHWLRPVTENKDYLLGDRAPSVYQNWFATPYNRCVYAIGVVTRSIKTMLAYGLSGIRFNEAIFTIPHHVRSMMLIRNQIWG